MPRATCPRIRFSGGFLTPCNCTQLEHFRRGPRQSRPSRTRPAALRQDLERVRNAWDDCQASRDRNAIYGYLTAVYGLVAVWAAEGREIDRTRRALRLQRLNVSDREESIRRGHSVHRRPSQGRQADQEQVVSDHEVRGPCTSRSPRRWISSSAGRAVSMRALLASPGGGSGPSASGTRSLHLFLYQFGARETLPRR